MAERDSWAVMNGATRVVDAEDARVGVGALWTPGSSPINARAGLRPYPGNPGGVAASGTPDINVKCAKFQLVLPASRGVGNYVCTLDADKTFNVLGTSPADPSNARRDLIIARQTDTFYGDGATAFTVMRITGTPAGTPVDPDPTQGGLYPDYYLLARLRIGAGDTAITGAMIDDLRSTLTVALGGVLPVSSATQRDAIPTPYDGMTVYRRDHDALEIADGSSIWRRPSVPTVGALADITAPYTGQLVFLISAGCLYRYNGSAWFPNTGFVAEGLWTADGPLNIAGTETVVDTVTFTAEANRRYKFDYRGSFVRGTAVGYQCFRLRWKAGASLTVAGSTKITGRNLTNSTVGDWYPIELGRSVTGITGGQVTVGMTAQRTSGTGNVEIRGDDDNRRHLTVDDNTGA